MSCVPKKIPAELFLRITAMDSAEREHLAAECCNVSMTVGGMNRVLAAQRARGYDITLDEVRDAAFLVLKAVRLVQASSFYSTGQ